jgi:hypothetical protein
MKGHLQRNGTIAAILWATVALATWLIMPVGH